ncbi:hypothetical protein BSLG_000679 [Batrachochytrium salamandrivorans]|nr:hypothetical protein BSLG_000679 [Batrachochytrium salamandrivorans]
MDHNTGNSNSCYHYSNLSASSMYSTSSATPPLLSDCPCDIDGFRDSWGQILDAKRVSDEIDRQLEAQRQAQRQTAQDPTMLILGGGDSGKTTFLKMLHISLNGGFSPDMMLRYHHQMMDNIVDSIKALLLASIALGYKVEPVQAKRMMLSYDRYGQIGLPKQLIESISQLWRHKGIQSCWKQSYKFKLQDTCDYFLDNVETKAQPGYRITHNDILHIRHSTTSISECAFKMNDFTLRFLDVAGQRGFRKQWAAHFDQVDSVLYITSVASYNQVLDEDKTVNRMTDSMQLFTELSKNTHLKNKALVLLLNKTDLLKKKLRYSKLCKYFPKYHGPNEIASVLEFFKQEFASRVITRKDRLYMHATCCTASESTSFLVAAVT